MSAIVPGGSFSPVLGEVTALAWGQSFGARLEVRNWNGHVVTWADALQRSADLYLYVVLLAGAWSNPISAGDITAMINSLNASPDGVTGFDAEIQPLIVSGDVVRVSDTELSIKMDLNASLDVSEAEDVTMAIPATAASGVAAGIQAAQLQDDGGTPVSGQVTIPTTIARFICGTGAAPPGVLQHWELVFDKTYTAAELAAEGGDLEAIATRTLRIPNNAGTAYNVVSFAGVPVTTGIDVTDATINSCYTEGPTGVYRSAYHYPSAATGSFSVAWRAAYHGSVGYNDTAAHSTTGDLF